MAATLELGLIVSLTDGVEKAFEKVVDLELPTCQLSCWAPSILDRKLATEVKASSKATGVKVSSFWAGHSGRTVWDFVDGPGTIGLVPMETRQERLVELKRGSDFAAMIEVLSVTTHVGFIDENGASPQYLRLIETLRDLAGHCGRHGQVFCFESGQETPVTLLRAIEDVGTDNLGINFDPANLILYGKANPLDALDVFGRHVRGVHAKDGHYPTDGRHLGREAVLGEGRVDFPALVRKLKTIGYAGPITIEREITGDRQLADVRRAIEILRTLGSD